MSTALARFLADYLIWAGDRENADVKMAPSTGLCYNAGPLRWELKAALIEDGLEPTTPFDTFNSYLQAQQSKTHHLNPRRLQWARKTLARLDIDLACRVFCRDWLMFAITKEEPVGAFFGYATGLCYNFYRWADTYDDAFAQWAQWQGGGNATPFNGGNMPSYSDEMDCTENPRRRAFAKLYAATLYKQLPNWMKNV